MLNSTTLGQGLSWEWRHWILDWSDNPAWVTLDILTQPVIGGQGTEAAPFYVVRFDGLDTARIDLPKFKEWADFCDELVPDGNGGQEKRLTFNGGFDFDTSMWEAALRVCQVGRATPVWNGIYLTLAIDKPADPVNLYSVGNIEESKFKEVFLPLEERATQIEIDYTNQENDYQRDKLTVYRPDVSNGQYKASLDLFGITKPSEAWRAGMYRLMCNRYLVRSAEIDVDIEALNAQIGDVVYIQHDVPRWGNGGRIVSATANTVTLDKEVTLESGLSYKILVRLSDDTVQEALVTDAPGTYTTLHLATNFAPIPQQYDVFAFGHVNSLARQFRITDISKSQDQKVTLSLIEYRPEIYDFEVLAPPANDFSQAALKRMEPRDMKLSQTRIMGPEGRTSAGIALTFTKSSDPAYRQCEVWFAAESGSDRNKWEWIFAGATPGTSFEITGVEYQRKYAVILIPVDIDGKKLYHGSAALNEITIEAPTRAAEIFYGSAPGKANLHTSGTSSTVTTTGNAFESVLVGCRLTANSQVRTVAEKINANTVRIDYEVNWDNNGAGHPFTYDASIGSLMPAEPGATNGAVIGANLFLPDELTLALEGDILNSSLTPTIQQAQSDIESAQQALSAAQTLITGLQGGLQTAQANISTLQGQIILKADGVGMGGNLLTNPDFFSQQLTDWTSDSVPSNVDIGFNHAGWQAYGIDTPYIHQGDGSQAPAVFDFYSSIIPAAPGSYYGFSVYTGCHNCAASVYLRWFDSNGAFISSSGLTSPDGTNDAEKLGGASLSGYKRIFVYAQAPSNAVGVVGCIRKYATKSGLTYSYVFFCRPQLEQFAPTQTKPASWTGIANSRVTNALVRIDGLNSQLILKASQVDLNTLGGRVTTAEADIDGLQGQIVLKAGQADLNALGGRVTTAEADIDGLQGEIVLKASQVYVDNLKIGGRNLVPNGSALKGTTGWSTNGLAIGYETLGNVTAFYFTCNLGTEVFLYSPRAKIKPSVKYTLRFLYQCSTNVRNVDCYVQSTNNPNASGITYTYSRFVGTYPQFSSFREVVYSFITEADACSLFLRFDLNGVTNPPNTGTLWIAECKIEEGDKATSWTPAPEDIDGDISSLGGRVTAAEVNINGLQSQVSLRAYAAGVGGNMLPNPDFYQQKFTNWAWDGLPANLVVGINLNSSWKAYGIDTPFIRQTDGSQSPAYLDFFSTLIPVSPDSYYGFSAYTGCHNCAAAVFLGWFDGAGVLLSYTGPRGGAGTNDMEKTGGESLANYKRIVISAQAPANARAVRCYIRKYATKSGLTYSYLFVCRPQLEQFAPTQTEPAPWTGIANSAASAAEVNINGIKSEVTIKVDNNGNVAGMGLIAGPTSSEFMVLADKFMVKNPANSSQPGKIPFVVGTVNGQSVVGISGDLLVDGSIQGRSLAVSNVITASAQIASAIIQDGHIQSLSAGKISAGSIDAGQVTIVSPDGKTRFSGNRIEVYDESNRLRVKLGSLS